MSWLAGFAGLYVLFQWIIPIAILLIAAFFAMRWARSRNEASSHAHTFSSALPEERDYKDEYWPLDPGASSDHDAHLHIRNRHD